MVAVKYLLDTNICIEVLRRRSPRIASKMGQLRRGEMGVSTAVVAELHYGAACSQQPGEELGRVRRLLSIMQVLPFSRGAAEHYGPLRRELEDAGTVIGAMDLMIAAHALSMDVPLVTHNIREFKRVTGLRVEVW